LESTEDPLPPRRSEEEQVTVQLGPLSGGLVRLLGWVLAGSFILSAATIAACRLSEATGGQAGYCRDLLPGLERKQADALETLVTLLAGAGIDRHH
jgi:hypothetical protein